MFWKPVENDSVRIPTREFRSAVSGKLRLCALAIGTLLHCTVYADVATWPRLIDPGTPAFSASADLLAQAGTADPAARTDAAAFELTESLLAWTEHAVRLIQKHQQNPQRAARSLALLHAAMHDAFVVAARERAGPARGAVAAHRAAGLVLAYLYPYEPASWIEGRGLLLAYDWSARLGASAESLRRELEIGDRVAADTIARALADGADRRNAGARPPDAGPGRWRATPPINVHTPQEALAGEWRPWIAGSLAVHAPPPPEYGSERFWRDAEEVYRVSRSLTPEQKTIAEQWNLQAGSVTPPGVWNQRALALIRSQRLEAAQAVRALAILNVAMNDAAIVCWRTKYEWWVVRPVSVIRERYDAKFLPHLVTPPHPSYTSGHSSVSGAAEIALGAFFPAQRAQLHAMAEEAAMSRLYGGIHYRSDNEQGLTLGRSVAEEVLKRAMPERYAQGIAGARP